MDVRQAIDVGSESRRGAEVGGREKDRDGADLGGWAFLTGSRDDIRDLTSRYGVFSRKNTNGEVDHAFLTSIVDPRGILRVQYVGARFDPEEFRRDLLSVAREH